MNVKWKAIVFLVYFNILLLNDIVTKPVAGACHHYLYVWIWLVSIYIWHVKDKDCQRIRPTQRGWNSSLVVAVSNEGVSAHDVTFVAYNTYKFLEFKVVPSL